VPIVDRDGKLLRRCKPNKARILMKKKKASPTEVNGVFAIRLKNKAKSRGKLINGYH
jgi:hypothetical protein